MKPFQQWCLNFVACENIFDSKIYEVNFVWAEKLNALFRQNIKVKIVKINFLGDELSKECRIEGRVWVDMKSQTTYK